MSDLLTEHFMIYHIEDPEFQGQKFTLIVFRALTYDHTPLVLTAAEVVALRDVQAQISQNPSPAPAGYPSADAPFTTI